MVLGAIGSFVFSIARRFVVSFLGSRCCGIDGCLFAICSDFQEQMAAPVLLGVLAHKIRVRIGQSLDVGIGISIARQGAT